MAALVAAFALVTGAGCGARPGAVSIEQVDSWENDWRVRPAAAYRIEVEVERPGDRRLSRVTVRGGGIETAEVTYWDAARGAWGATAPLDEAQARPFTVEGLYRTLRAEMEAGGRSETRIAVEGDPPVPRRILLGPRLRDGRPVPGSEAALIVRHFEIEPPPG